MRYDISDLPLLGSARFRHLSFYFCCHLDAHRFQLLSISSWIFIFNLKKAVTCTFSDFLIRREEDEISYLGDEDENSMSSDRCSDETFIGNFRSDDYGYVSMICIHFIPVL